jgi:hypothetical protein
MFKDTQLIITFQLALIGIVLIGGLFLIWKAVTRVEEKVDMVVREQDIKAFKFNLDNGCCPMSMMNADSVMQDIFHDEQPIIATLEDFVVNPLMTKEAVQDLDKNAMTIEEVSNDVAMSEVSEYVSGSVLTKSKLKQMTIDKIKAMCEDKGLPSNGTKNQLIDKLLA